MAEVYTQHLVYKNSTRPGMNVWRPQTPISGKLYPLIVALHGIGERGNGTDSDGRLTKLKGIGYFYSLEQGALKYGCIVIEPQTSGYFRSNEVNQAIAYAKANYPIDPKRIYLTGFSLGGGGCYAYMGLNADAHLKIAACSPMAPGGPGGFITNDTEWKNLANTKLTIWNFHASDDTGPYPSQSTEVYYNKAKAINPNVKIIKSFWKTGGHQGGWKTWPRYEDTAKAINCTEG